MNGDFSFLGLRTIQGFALSSFLLPLKLSKRFVAVATENGKAYLMGFLDPLGFHPFKDSSQNGVFFINSHN